MNIFDQKTLGIVMLVMLAVLVIVKRIATGSTFDAPRGNLAVRLINSFNLFFLLIVIPGTSLLMMTGRLETLDPLRMVILDPWVQPVWYLVGLVIYSLGHILMGWALICLGRNYQIGGIPPRAEHEIITDGPFRIIRHPVYTAALGIALGLVLLTQSGALLGVFVTYLLLIIILIGIEEEDLQRVYPEQYSLYRENAKKLIPFVY
jgi:protein-S-isoprenylcysteine O-methyltransferase Ste14